MPYLRSDDGVYLYYREEGEGDPILLVHGLTFSHEAFARNVPELARTHRVVAVDIRGHGYSGKQDLGWTMEQTARDIAGVVDHLGLSDAVIVGWSMGSLAVLDYLDRFGQEKVKGAVLVEQSPRPLIEEGWEHGQVNPKGMVEFSRRVLGDRLGFQQGFVSTCFAGGEAPDEATRESWLRESMLTPTGAVLAYGLNSATNDYRGVLPRLTVPVLLCYGARSVIFRTNVGDYMLRQMPDGELMVFEESGHSPFWEEPERFNAEVLRFAGRQPAER